MKTLMLLACSLALNVAFAGPTISGGIGYHQDLEKCINKQADVQLSIEANITPQIIGGYMHEGKTSSYALRCVEGKNTKSAITGEENVWTCFEDRIGEGQLQVHINRKNSGIKYGIVYRYDIIGRLSEMYKLKCDQQVSN